LLTILNASEALVGRLDLRREERGGGHGLLDAHHLVGLVADQARRDTIVALLDGAGASDRHVEHGSLICCEGLLIGLIQSI